MDHNVLSRSLRKRLKPLLKRCRLHIPPTPPQQQGWTRSARPAAMPDPNT